MDQITQYQLVMLYRNLTMAGDLSHLMLSHLQLFENVFHETLMDRCGEWLQRGARPRNLDAFVGEVMDTILETAYGLDMCLRLQAWSDAQNLDLRVAFPDEMKESLSIGLGVWWGKIRKAVSFASCTEVHVVYDREDD